VGIASARADQELQVLERRCLGSLAVFAQEDALGMLSDVEAVGVMLGKGQPGAELPARAAEQRLVSARTYQRLGADRQMAVLARLG
jgi:hypothetical protein